MIFNNKGSLSPTWNKVLELWSSVFYKLPEDGTLVTKHVAVGT